MWSQALSRSTRYVTLSLKARHVWRYELELEPHKSYTDN